MNFNFYAPDKLISGEAGGEYMNKTLSNLGLFKSQNILNNRQLNLEKKKSKRYMCVLKQVTGNTRNTPRVVYHKEEMF